MAFVASVHAKVIDLIKLSLDMTTAAGSGHPTSAASLAHLVTVLMYTHMRYDPAHPNHAAADRLVLSEGHACPIIYAAAADLGLAIGKDPEHWRPMTRDDALRLRAIDSEIDGHPNPAEGFPFFPAATGSLGQGLSIANGLALAARLDGLDKRIFCLIGDGESREGQIWEAVDFLMDHHLTAVCPIFNCNGYGQSDAVSPQQELDVTAAKLRAAGMTVRVIDGHNPREIQRALEVHASHADNPTAKPFAIVAQTEKGWGFTSVLGRNGHGRAAAEAEKAQALTALDAMAQHLGAALTKGDLQRPPVPAVEVPPPQPTQEAPSFREALRRYGQEGMLDKGVMSRFNLKLVGSHVGVSLAADGPSQMALPDVAFFRALTTVRTPEGHPLLYLLQPADAYAAYALTVAMAAHEGPCYLRTLRPDVPFLYNDATAFSLGGHHVLAEGHDLCIIAAGYMVHEARKALPLLKERGIEATLVDLYSLPFDDVAILELAQENHGQVLTVEDNYGAGIGSAVADALALHGGSYTLTQMYVRQIPKSGRTPDEVLRSLQLSASDIVHTAVSMLNVAAR